MAAAIVLMIDCVNAKIESECRSVVGGEECENRDASAYGDVVAYVIGEVGAGVHKSVDSYTLSSKLK